MIAVWKYALEIADEQEIVMPWGAELLHVADQEGGIGTPLALWARVNTAQPEVRRLILIRGTGHSVDWQPYVGTVVTARGALVWHVFDGGDQ